VGFVLTLLQVASEETFISMVKYDLRTLRPTAAQPAREGNKYERS
jgi:hypothetical protein